MGYSGITKKNGHDFNFYQETSVNWTTFGGGASDGQGPDQIIPFQTQGVMVLNKGSGTVEFSFNGTTVHGELASGTPTAGLAWDSRIISLIWFRVKSGSSGPIIIAVQAWATP